MDPEIIMVQDVVQSKYGSEESAQHGRHRPMGDDIVDSEIIISQDSVRVSMRPRLDDFVDPSIRIVQDYEVQSEHGTDETVPHPNE